MLFGEAVIEQRYVSGADMGIAGWGRRNACSDNRVRHELFILRQIAVAAGLAIPRRACRAALLSSCSQYSLAQQQTESPHAHIKPDGPKLNSTKEEIMKKTMQL